MNTLLSALVLPTFSIRGVYTFCVFLSSSAQALLDDFLFWQDEATEPPTLEPGSGRSGYKKLRGYPKELKNDTVLLLEVQPIGHWEEALSDHASSTTAAAVAAGSSGSKLTQVIGATGLPGRSLRVLRRPKTVAEREFACLKAVAVELERLGSKLLAKPAKKLKSKSSALPEGQNQAKEPIFKVGDTVEFDMDGTGNKWVDCEVLKVHSTAASGANGNDSKKSTKSNSKSNKSNGGMNGKDYLFDIEPREAWVGRQLKCPAMFLRRKSDDRSKNNQEGVGIWKFAGLSDSEDEDWKHETSDDEESVDAGKSRRSWPNQRSNTDSDSGSTANGEDGISKLPFAWFDRLPSVLEAASWDDTICVTVLRKLAAVPGVKPFTSMDRLAAAVATEVNLHFKDDAAMLHAAKLKADQQAGPEHELLNLLGAPRKSRLHSLAKTLARVENLSHVLAWTDRRNPCQVSAAVNDDHSTSDETNDQEKEEFKRQINKSSGSSSGYEYAAEVGCPVLSLIELPRLKLAFTGRVDPDGETRLYSLDHTDLFVTNHRHPLVNRMLQGIPHSLLLSNLRGELQVLVPVLAPVRPPVGAQPFTTTLVLDRSDATWAAALSSRYFMYPVHVSTSFLVTKGLNAALYLLLLRLLHRDYDDAYRLTDSVATDTAFSDEGLCIFKALSFANDDAHPDAHAVSVDTSILLLFNFTCLAGPDLTRLHSLRFTLDFRCASK